MKFISGQGVLGKIPFKDGVVPEKDRTYLIITTEANYIEVLNVSSVRGKERKLAFSSNEKLRVYRPPFLKPSFVKLDSLTQIYASQWSELQLLHKGQTLDSKELSRIKEVLRKWQISNK